MSRAILNVVAAKWIESLRGSLSEGGRYIHTLYARGWVAWFDDDLGNVTESSLGDLVRERLRHVVRSTVKKERSALKKFLAWCEEKGLGRAPEVPPIPAKAMGTRARIVKKAELSPRDTAKILAALPETTPRGALVRDRYRVAYETGLRPSTVARLVAGVHFAPGWDHLHVTSDIDKARYERKVPLTSSAREILDRVCPESGPIFGAHDTRDAWATAVRATGIDATPYDLRRAAGTHLVDSGAPLTGVAYLLGHKQISTTSIYLQATRKAAETALGSRRLVGSVVGQALRRGEKFRVKGVTEVSEFIEQVRRTGLEPVRLLTASTSIKRDVEISRDSWGSSRQTTTEDQQLAPPLWAEPTSSLLVVERCRLSLEIESISWGTFDRLSLEENSGGES